MKVKCSSEYLKKAGKKWQGRDGEKNWEGECCPSTGVCQGYFG